MAFGCGQRFFGQFDQPNWPNRQWLTLAKFWLNDKLAFRHSQRFFGHFGWPNWPNGQVLILSTSFYYLPKVTFLIFQTISFFVLLAIFKEFLSKPKRAFTRPKRPVL